MSLPWGTKVALEWSCVKFCSTRWFFFLPHVCPAQGLQWTTVLQGSLRAMPFLYRPWMCMKDCPRSRPQLLIVGLEDGWWAWVGGTLLAEAGWWRGCPVGTGDVLVSHCLCPKFKGAAFGHAAAKSGHVFFRACPFETGLFLCHSQLFFFLAPFFHYISSTRCRRAHKNAPSRQCPQVISLAFFLLLYLHCMARCPTLRSHVRLCSTLQVWRSRSYRALQGRPRILTIEFDAMREKSSPWTHDLFFLSSHLFTWQSPTKGNEMIVVLVGYPPPKWLFRWSTSTQRQKQRWPHPSSVGGRGPHVACGRGMMCPRIPSLQSCRDINHDVMCAMGREPHGQWFCRTHLLPHKSCPSVRFGVYVCVCVWFLCFRLRLYIGFARRRRAWRDLIRRLQVRLSSAFHESGPHVSANWFGRDDLANSELRGSEFILVGNAKV